MMVHHALRCPRSLRIQAPPDGIRTDDPRLIPGKKQPMRVNLFDYGYRQTIGLLVVSLAVLTGCSSKPQPSASAPAQQASSTAAPAAPAQQPAPATFDNLDADVAQQKTALVLPKHFGRFTGDRDGMVKNGRLRALVIYSKGGFY